MAQMNIEAELRTLPTANTEALLQTTSSTYQKEFGEAEVHPKDDVRSEASMLLFNVIHYEDETGKRWKFARLKDKRAFIREDGKEFSHTALYTKYSFVKRIKKHEIDA